MQRFGTVVPLVSARALSSREFTDELPAALVDLALWIAEYYGSTPARALELVAPLRRKRRDARTRSVGERQSLQGEAAPARLSPAQEAALSRVEEAFAR